MAAMLAAIAVWEWVIARILDRHTDDRARKVGPEQGLVLLSITVFVGSLVYATMPALLIARGTPLSAYLAMAWLMGTLLHVFVYYSNSLKLLLPQAIVPSVLLLVHPFVFLSSDLHAAIAAATLALLIAALCQFALDRNALLAQVARKDREKRAADEANEAKSVFIANMSHELRTPLNAIIGYADIIVEESEPTNKQLRADTGRISVAGNHLLGLIDEILDISKLNAGQIRIQPVEMDIGPWAREVIDMARPLAGAIAQWGSIGPIAAGRPSRFADRCGAHFRPYEPSTWAVIPAFSRARGPMKSTARARHQ